MKKYLFYAWGLMPAVLFGGDFSIHRASSVRMYGPSGQIMNLSASEVSTLGRLQKSVDFRSVEADDDEGLVYEIAPQPYYIVVSFEKGENDNPSDERIYSVSNDFSFSDFRDSKGNKIFLPKKIIARWKTLIK